MTAKEILDGIDSGQFEIPHQYHLGCGAMEYPHAMSNKKLLQLINSGEFKTFFDVPHKYTDGCGAIEGCTPEVHEAWNRTKPKSLALELEVSD